MNEHTLLSRRTLLAGLAGQAALGAGLEREVGITTSSLTGHVALRPDGAQTALLDLPRFLRDELDMRVIDLNTRTIEGASHVQLETLRKNAESAGCVLTNLKLNQTGLALDAADEAVRTQALSAYRRSIDEAALLGCRWVRVLPERRRPDWNRYVSALREVTDYARSKGLRLLVENYGWMDSDPGEAVRLIKTLSRDVAAQPDTGNWSSDDVRFPGLSALFPLAVSCDFKAMELAPDGSHEAYDLHRCFLTGWQAGFRGPWCIEYLHKDRATELRGLRMVRDMLRKWMQTG